MTLFEISTAFREVAALLEESGGECTPETLARIEELERDQQDKAKAYVMLIRELTVEAGAISAEATRLSNRAKAKESAAARLKERLLQHLQALQITKLDLGIATVSVQTAPRPSIRWMGEGEPPVTYTRTKVELDGTRAYDAWRVGTLPEGFEVKHTTFLQIR